VGVQGVAQSFSGRLAAQHKRMNQPKIICIFTLLACLLPMVLSASSRGRQGSDTTAAAFDIETVACLRGASILIGPWGLQVAFSQRRMDSFWFVNVIQTVTMTTVTMTTAALYFFFHAALNLLVSMCGFCVVMYYLLRIMTR
jgi:hypothetical protein